MKSIFSTIAALGAISAACAQGAKAPRIALTDPDGTVHISAIVVPQSAYASPQAHDAWVARAKAPRGPGLTDGVKAAREYYQKYNDELAARMRVLYPVHIENKTIGGVRTEV